MKNAIDSKEVLLIFKELHKWSKVSSTISKEVEVTRPIYSSELKASFSIVT